MLPDADDFPALAAELAGDAAVAGHVGLAFAVPKGAVGFRSGVALGAAMPSTIRRRKRRGFALGTEGAAATEAW
jgi:hypothetical protein